MSETHDEYEKLNTLLDEYLDLNNEGFELDLLQARALFNEGEQLTEEQWSRRDEIRARVGVLRAQMITEGDRIAGLGDES
jgi:hypothetical protein